MSQERRCATCGALVSSDAEWCGQCFAPLRNAEPLAEAPSAPASAAVREAARLGIQVEGGQTTWICPACDHRNPIDAARCTVCGTEFGRLFAEPEVRPEIEPRTAALWSMAFPGLGHWHLDHKGDAVARSVMFAWAFGSLLVLLASRSGEGGLGPTTPLFLTFLLAAVAIYILSALDAYRIASGADPLVSSRALLWGSVGLIVLSVVIATFVTLPAARR